MPALTGFTTSEPNEFGVYPDDAAEVFTLSRQQRGWRGMPTAEIKLLHIEAGWIEASSYYIRDTAGSRGDGYGLDPKWGVYQSRGDALDHAASRLRHGARNPQNDDCRRILAWLDGLIPDQADLFAALPDTDQVSVRMGVGR